MEELLIFEIQVPSSLLWADQNHFLLWPKIGCEITPKMCFLGSLHSIIQKNTHFCVRAKISALSVDCTNSERIYENGS